MTDNFTPEPGNAPDNVGSRWQTSDPTPPNHPTTPSYPVPRNQNQGMTPAQPLSQDMSVPRKSKTLAIVLALPFLPTAWLGIHDFYLGHTFRGILHLFFALLGIIPFLWIAVNPVHGAIILLEFLLIIVSAGGYGRDRQGRPLV